MTDTEKRIKIAEKCGFSKIQTFGPWYNLFGQLGDISYIEIPDYLSDLNAMHEAEKQMDGKWMGYEACLRSVCRGNPICHATARQRADAFLRTIGEEL